MRFLMIEDSADLAQSVAERLRLDGHAVDHAGSLADAEDCLSAAPYDLILLDLSLPDGDGRDFLIRQRRARRDVPIIVMTARAGVADRVDVLDLGADDYVNKTVRFRRTGSPMPGRSAPSRRSHADGAAIRGIHFQPLDRTSRDRQ